MELAEGDPWSWRTENHVIVCDQRGWHDGTETQIKRLMTQFDEVASQNHITACVTVLDPGIDLGPERQAVLEENGPVYDQLGIEKVAFVSDGIAGMALKSLVEMPEGMEIETFDQEEPALAWAGD